MLVSLDTADATPIYAQVERGLRAAIAAGRLKPGDQLPTVRELAVELRINANTVARVYSELERAGVFETRRGVGTFVRAGRAEARPPSEHAKRLRAFATRVLSEGDAHGFTADEVIAALRAHRSMK
jgi:GntR family transcriptional regulator